MARWRASWQLPVCSSQFKKRATDCGERCTVCGGRSAVAVLSGRPVVGDDVVVRVGGEADALLPGFGRLHELFDSGKDDLETPVVHGQLAFELASPL